MFCMEQLSWAILGFVSADSIGRGSRHFRTRPLVPSAFVAM